VEIPIFAETGWRAYVDGLATLEPYVRQAEEVIPGHGRRSSAAGDSPVSRWEADMAYLEQAATGGGHDDPRMSSGPAWLWDSHHGNLRSMAAGSRRLLRHAPFSTRGVLEAIAFTRPPRPGQKNAPYAFVPHGSPTGIGAGTAGRVALLRPSPRGSRARTCGRRSASPSPSHTPPSLRRAG